MFFLLDYVYWNVLLVNSVISSQLLKATYQERNEGEVIDEDIRFLSGKENECMINHR